jgi:hypothetical protein
MNGHSWAREVPAKITFPLISGAGILRRNQ